MNVFAVNCGSSTLKFDVIQADGTVLALGGGRRLARGIVDRIGGDATVEFHSEEGAALRTTSALAGHAEAVRRALDWVRSLRLLQPNGIAAVGHRVVHGGDRFMEPVLIDDEVIAAIDRLTELAPLHNAPALSAIRAVREVLGAGIPMVATFDTAFHRTMPERASQYAIPLELAAKHHIRRYGFHGLAHRYMAERYAAVTSLPMEQVKVVTVQLGNGCSATAIDAGRSIDTSMGFTPLEGLVMGTRSGDVDPSLAGFLADKEGIAIEEVEGWLNKRSGLLGVSGRSRDMRELLEAEEQGDARAALAVEMFCYRVRKYIGAYLAALGGAGAIVLGGGIGENSPRIRKRICSGMEWCGLILDEERNARARGSEAMISADVARIGVYVIPVDEAAMIAGDTIGCLSSQK